MTQPSTAHAPEQELQRSLGLYSAVTLVAGSMIGSGIFIVSADITRQVQSPGLLLAVWLFTGLITLLGATAFGKLAAKFPKSGGQYVFLREAWGDLPAFMYGWTMFTVIQTGFLAAVALAFCKYFGVIFPALTAEATIPVMLGWHVSPQQVLAIGLLLFLTMLNTRGVQYGALVQNIMTTIKFLSLLAVIGIGFAFGSSDLTPAWNSQAFWAPADASIISYLPALFAFASVGALFSSDAWNYVTFIGGEIKQAEKNIPKALALGTIFVVLVYFLVNVAYLRLLPMDVIQHAPQDRVASEAMKVVLGGAGEKTMAAVILVSTFGCLNGMILAGARVFYAMAKDGLLFPVFGRVNPTTHTPNASLWIQCAWAILLALSGSYGQLLDYLIFASIVFYIVTILGLFKLAKSDPAGYQLKSAKDYIAPVLYVAGVAYIGFYLLIGEEKWVTSVTGLGLAASAIPVYFIWKRFSKASLQAS